MLNYNKQNIRRIYWRAKGTMPDGDTLICNSRFYKDLVIAHNDVILPIRNKLGLTIEQLWGLNKLMITPTFDDKGYAFLSIGSGKESVVLTEE